MLKSMVRVLAVIALLVGFSACAKYPHVVNSASAPAPSAAAQPAR